MSSPREAWPALIKLRMAVARENAPLATLLQRTGSAEAACAAPAALWEEVCGFRADPERLGPGADLHADRMASELDGLGAAILSVLDSDYPAALRRLPQPPAVLFALGRTELLDRPAIALVGTRRHSLYGRDAAVSFAVGLVRAGYIVISGMARGIDGIAHRAAIDVGGDTVGVLGNGLDIIYPPEHRELWQAIAERGCLVTEFPPGAPPRKHHFPQRNRIIAGLARAVLVVEAPERSGALITAHYAMEEGKEVFAVPGPVHNPTSQGPHRLIQDGAGLVTSVADLLEMMPAHGDEPAAATGAAAAIASAGARSRVAASGSPFDDLSPAADTATSGLARRVWEALSAGSTGTDELAAALSAQPAALATALLELELAGLVERLPGPRYARAARAHGVDSVFT